MQVLDMFKLDGKVALVTGGAGNYGRQMTEALAEAGATVITASRSLESNEAYAAQLRARGLKVYADSFDQSDDESIHGLLARLVEKFGKVDILVNNSVLRCFKDYHAPAEDYAKSMAVNATGLFLMCRAFGDTWSKMGMAASSTSAPTWAIWAATRLCMRAVPTLPASARRITSSTRAACTI